MSLESIPMLDVAAQNAPFADELRAAFDRVLTSGRFILGPEVAAFEEEVAAYLGVKHAIGVSSGTDALLVALMALDVGPGDEVITTPFTFFATGGCIARLGARPVFVDIDPETFNLDVSQIRITERTKAIVPVHLFGQSCDMKELTQVAGGVPVIEDAAQALGARCGDTPVGTLGAFGCFSFFPSKNLGAFGDGGLVTTNDDDLAEKARVLRAHGSKPKYFHAVVGGNFRLDALQAALLRVKLPHLDGWHRARQENAAFYDSFFQEAGPSSLRTPVRREEGHVYNQYVVRTDRRDELQQHLRDQGIATAIYYPRPLHLQQCFEDLGYRPGSLPQAEKAASEVLAIPVFPDLGPARLNRIAQTITTFL
ncbi:MAG: DegT/DnrJ/EryC1/StrS family aminotransferase [Myxococcota bacterium]